MQKNQQSQAITQIKYKDIKIECGACNQHIKTGEGRQEPVKHKIRGKDKGGEGKL